MNIQNRVFFMQVYDNGIVSLDGAFRADIGPRFLSQTRTDKFIAPYWADFDTSRTGNTYYRQTTDPSLLGRVTNEIRAAFPMYQDLTMTNMFIATWDSINHNDHRVSMYTVCTIHCQYT